MLTLNTRRKFHCVFNLDELNGQLIILDTNYLNYALAEISVCVEVDEEIIDRDFMVVLSRAPALAETFVDLIDDYISTNLDGVFVTEDLFPRNITQNILT